MTQNKGHYRFIVIQEGHQFKVKPVWDFLCVTYVTELQYLRLPRCFMAYLHTAVVVFGRTAYKGHKVQGVKAAVVYCIPVG